MENERRDTKVKLIRGNSNAFGGIVEGFRKTQKLITLAEKGSRGDVGKIKEMIESDSKKLRVGDIRILI